MKDTDVKVTRKLSTQSGKEDIKIYIGEVFRTSQGELARLTRDSSVQQPVPSTGLPPGSSLEESHPR